MHKYFFQHIIPLTAQQKTFLRDISKASKAFTFFLDINRTWHFELNLDGVSLQQQ